MTLPANETSTRTPDDVSGGRKAARRLVPLLALLLFVNYLDRVNVGFAAPTMNADLGITTTAYGFGVAIFFVGYVILEVPSNYVMYRVGARRWLARIAITWGFVAAAHSLIVGPSTFALVRVLLGIAEAGLLPGILWYISRWFTGRQRIQVLGIYYVAVPLSTAVGGPLSNWLIRHGNETLGVEGWRFMFAAEGLLAVVLGLAVLRFLPDGPAEARWLTTGQRDALIAAARAQESGAHRSFVSALRSRTTLTLAATFLLLTFPMFAISFFLPLVTTQLAGAGNTSAVDVVTFIPFLLGAVASYTWSRAAERRGLRSWRFAAPAALAGIGVATCAVGGSLPVLLGGVVLAAVGIYGAIPIFWSLASEKLGGSAASASGLALVNTVGSIGGFVAGYFTGWLRDLTGGYELPFLVMALSLFASAIVALSLRGRASMRENLSP